ncbi:MAG: cellulase family glycosylhydrolase [Chloroflexi bacterium]|nr:cellulase family glycosylhydrolase [Chloroflexota bacterium]
MRRIAVLILALVVATTGFPLAQSTDAHVPNPDVTYFTETGHNLAFGFRFFWNSRGGLDIFGLPLTEEISEEGRAVQYFERAVFEYFPEFKDTPFETQLRLLGRLLTAGRENEPPFRPIPFFPDNPNNRFFPEASHSLSFGFKNFWDAHGGLPIFGFPISEEFDERNPDNGQTYTVQYFERARFEYHPEFAGTPYEVELGRLGAQLSSRLSPTLLIRTVPIPGPRPPATFPLVGPHLGYGMNVFLPGQDADRVLGLVKSAGFDWARQPIQWATIEPAKGQFNFSETDFVVNSMFRNDVHSVLAVHRSPAWATANGGSGFPFNSADFRDFMFALASRYRNMVDGYEMWNEENIFAETGGIDVGKYVDLLRAGFEGVKAADPFAVVIFGGLTPTGVVDPNNAIDDALYLQQTYQYQGGIVKNFFDVLGVHPGGNNNAPDLLWPDMPGSDGWSNHPSFYFRRVENLRAIMEQNGDTAKQVWITEFGWTTANAAPGYEYGAQITDQLQAQYLVRAYQKAKSDYPWVGVMIMWNLNYSTVVPPTDEKFPWAIINSDFSPRPSYIALSNMPKDP